MTFFASPSPLRFPSLPSPFRFPSLNSLSPPPPFTPSIPGVNKYFFRVYFSISTVCVFYAIDCIPSQQIYDLLMQQLRNCLDKPQPDGLNPIELLLFPFYDARLRYKSGAGGRSDTGTLLRKPTALYEDLQNLANQHLQSYSGGRISLIWKRLAETTMKSANVVPLFWRQYLLNQTSNLLHVLNTSVITVKFST